MRTCWLAPFLLLRAWAAEPFLYRNADPVRPTVERFVRPALAEPPILNPPGFRWPAHAGAAYDLEISADPQFQAAGVIRRSNLPLNLYTHDAPLKTGTWYWRTRVHGTAGWSEVRQFVVDKDLFALPVPDAAQAIAKLRGAGRPRLFITAATLPAWRKSISTTRRAAWQQLAAALKEARASKGDEPAMPANAKGTDPATADAFFRARTYAARVTEQAQLLSLAYLLSGDPADGAAAKRVVLAIAAWDPDGVTSRKTNDPVFRLVLEALTRSYDWLAATDLLSQPERRRIEDAVTRRGRDLWQWYAESKPHTKWPYESHVSGSLGYCGELGVAFAGALPEAGDFLRYYLTMMTANYPSYGLADGSWHEGPGYWKWTMGSHVPAAASVSRALGLELLKHPYLANTGDFKLYADPPWATLSPFGDALGSKPGGEDAYVMAKLAAATGKSRYAWYAGRLRPARIETAEDFLMLSEETPSPATPPNDMPLARVFPDTGLAVLRTSLTDPKADIQFMVKSSPFGSVSHGHADQGNFYLAAYGKPLAIPTGYYGASVGSLYGGPHHATWMWQSWAHNVPLVDGVGQAARTGDAAGRIEHFYHSEVVDHVRVDATQAYRAASPKSAVAELEKIDSSLSRRSGGAPVESYRRSVVFLRPSAFIVFDDLRASRPVRFDWLLHALNPMQLGEREVTIENQDARLAVRILAPVNLSQSDRFIVPPFKKWKPQSHLTAALTNPSDTHRVVTVLLPHRPGDRLPSTSAVHGAGWTGVELRAGNESTTVAFATAREFEMPGAKAAARLLVIHDGPSPWIYAADVTRLSIDNAAGARTWNYPRPVDLLLRHGGEPIVSTGSTR